MRAGHERFFDLWSNPTTQFIGENKANGYVTCEPDWRLHTQTTGIGNFGKAKAPIRWWQAAADDQVEEAIPNIKNVSINRDISQDAGTATITLANQWMKTNFASQLANELGYPGYFTFNRGASAEARSRWNHQANSWIGKIVPGALLRTYQGWGGHNLSREDAIDEGYITLTGVWIVDDVTIGAKSGLIELNCRDMMALLIDQILYTPLVPNAQYPIRYQRWVDTTFKIQYQPKKPTPPVYGPGSPIPVRYETSSVDQWYGSDFSLYGHRGSHSADGSSLTYALGEGNSGPDKPFAVNFWQYKLSGQQVSAIQVHCWKGGYQMYVSVMERGRWVGASYVPYDPSSLVGNQPTVVNTGARIPYVLQVGCPSETLFTVKLPRPMAADRIRISFRHLAYSGIGNPPTSWPYRAGVRTFKALATKQITAAQTRPYGWGSVEAHPTGDGYWTQSWEGKIHAFGQCVHHGDRFGKTSNTYVDLVSTPTGDGYWVMNHKGQIAAFGDAVHHGQWDIAFANSGAVALARTYTGDGYWIMFRSGNIIAYGDAPDYGPVTLSNPSSNVVVDFDSMKDDYGYWVLDDDGNMYNYGAAADHGDPNDVGDFARNHGQAIDVAPEGEGYLVMGFAGWVSGWGDLDLNNPYGVPRIGAVSAGYRPQAGVHLESIAINAANTGYWAISTDGEIYTRGDANRWGSPKEGAGTIRRDGNYKDYADIIRDICLWSGFWFKENLSPFESPAVYGNIEYTGIYSPEPLPQDMFDKRPPIDPINQLKEIVGYICWVDDEGAFRWESPNWWQAGNFYDIGGHTDFIPEIDERIQLTDYKVRFTKSKDRSEIIITTDEPTAGFEDTVTTRYVPSNSLLRGMISPTMIKVPAQVTKEEQEVMAELIALHLWFARRVGNVSCIANPALQINDQVRIFERVTSETFVHYVRGISSTHDFETGRYTMDLTTNWLGTEEGSWAITAQNIPLPVGADPVPESDQFPISPRLILFLENLAKSETRAEVPVTQSEDVDNPPADDGAGPST